MESQKLFYSQFSPKLAGNCTQRNYFNVPSSPNTWDATILILAFSCCQGVVAARVVTSSVFCVIVNPALAAPLVQMVFQQSPLCYEGAFSSTPLTAPQSFLEFLHFCSSPLLASRIPGNCFHLIL